MLLLSYKNIGMYIYTYKYVGSATIICMPTKNQNDIMVKCTGFNYCVACKRIL